jgi:phage shock protein C
VTDRLYRSPTDRVIAGVAGGLAVWLNIDPSLVRIAWVLLGIFSGGIFVLVYFVMMIVVPLPPPGWVPQPRGSYGGPAAGGWTPGSPGPGAMPGWDPGAGTSPDATAGSPGWGAAEAPGSPAVPGPGWTVPPGSASQQPWVAPRVDTGSAGIVAGVILVLLGAWFLVDQYVDIRIDWAVLWPVIVIVLGAALIFGALRRRAGG